MKILAIESSCDDTSAAVTEERRVLSCVTSSQIEEHRLYGGVVPEIASRRHTENIIPVVDAALNEAGLKPADIGAVSVTYAPGLIGAVLVGVNFAKSFALARRIPLVPVHHLRGHIAANYITSPGLEPPFLALVVSGGHSHIVEVKSYTDFSVIGRTRDDAAGECFDKSARALGMPYPGGVFLDKAAEEGDEKAYPLPRPRVSDSRYDFSFSGMKTAVINTVHNAGVRGEKIRVNDMAASVRRAVVDMLTDNLFAAAADYGYKTVALAGGVSANSLLRREAQRRCDCAGIELFMPELRWCGDNAAMIGAQGFYELQAGHTAGPELNARATMPIDNLTY